ncbi:MAG TPA: glycosyltransferase [Polyangia bacterium]|nr:glycosyltransferase [Polyangia bacterium]
MKVALFVHGFPIPSETFVIHHAAVLRRAGVDLSIICETAGDWTALPADLRGDLEGRVVRLPPPRSAATAARSMLGAALRSPWARGPWRRGWAAAVALVQRDRQALRDVGAAEPLAAPSRFDAILAHFGPTGVRAAALRRAGLLSGPIGTVFHGYDVSQTETLRRYGAKYRALFRDTELLLPVSEFWARRLRSWGAPADKVRVLRMGVALPPEPPPRAGRPPGERLRVLTVGRFVEKKGIEYALAGVASSRRPVDLTVIGAGQLEPELRRLAARVNAAGGDHRVTFLGQRPHASVLEHMEAADVLLLPSVTAADGDMEGVPVVLMEAMARGCLVVATRHSGNAELIEDGVSGLLVGERSAAEIGAALDAVAGGQIDASAMRRAARAAIRGRFDEPTTDAALLSSVALLARRVGRRPRLGWSAPSPAAGARPEGTASAIGGAA